jgi:hypothetical protein
VIEYEVTNGLVPLYESPDPTWSVRTTTTSVTVDGLLADWPTEFFVRARNARGWGTWSTSTPQVLPFEAPRPPGPPLFVHAWAGEESAVLRWAHAIASTAYPITQYRISVEPGGRTFTSPASAPLALTIGGLRAGVTYTFSVGGTNAGGDGPAAPSEAVTPHPATPANVPADPRGGPAPVPATTGDGYWVLTSDGRIAPFGGVAHVGDAGRALAGGGRAVDLEATASGNGYWVLDDRGGVHAFGDAQVHAPRTEGVLAPGERAVSLSHTDSGQGYWVFTDRGRAIRHGDAEAFGDLAGLVLNAPVLDSIVTRSGAGYYMVAADGGVFAFGDARFHGSMGGRALNAPVRSLVPDADGDGYWLVAGDGGVFSFDAPFLGSMGSTPLNAPVVGMVRFEIGYLMVASDGGVFNFSDQPFQGSLAEHPLTAPAVNIAGYDGRGR